ncbi:hypothetical protein D3C85_1198650 [compost metagenome]
MVRNSNSNWHRSGMVLTDRPPEMTPVFAVESGTSKSRSNGPCSRCLSAMSRIWQMARAAYSMALTPCGVSEECAACPCTVHRYRLLLLCAEMTRISVGSPTTQLSGRMPSRANSCSIVSAPRQPTSSS